jgi:hypothetical protein
VFACGKLCGNCVKPCASRLARERFLKIPVEKSILVGLKNFLSIYVFSPFSTKINKIL